jgi:hypothetical protein
MLYFFVSINSKSIREDLKISAPIPIVNSIFCNVFVTLTFLDDDRNCLIYPSFRNLSDFFLREEFNKVMILTKDNDDSFVHIAE